MSFYGWHIDMPAVVLRDAAQERAAYHRGRERFWAEQQASGDGAETAGMSMGNKATEHRGKALDMERLAHFMDLAGPDRVFPVDYNQIADLGL